MTNFTDALRIASLKALEDWGMMLVDEQPAPSAAMFVGEEDLFATWVDVSGSVSGRISVVAQLSFLEALCCNVLGQDPETVEQEDRLDAFRELSNILTGAFLTAAFDQRATFDLYVSHVEVISLAELEGAVSPESHILFLADDSPVLVSIQLAGGAPRD